MKPNRNHGDKNRTRWDQAGSQVWFGTRSPRGELLAVSSSSKGAPMFPRSSASLVDGEVSELVGCVLRG